MFEKREGRFLRHTPCEVCGSSDAKAVYDTDTAFCFSCNTYFPHVDNDNNARTVQHKRRYGLLTDITYKPLKVRKISEETCRKYGYGYSVHRGEVVQVAPYYYKGELVAQHLRDKEKNFSWVGNAKHLELFGQGLWQSGGKRLVITEGEIDCLTVAQVFNLKWPVVSVPNGASSAKKYIKQNLEFVESFEEIVLAFDNDEPGRAATSECAQLLTPGKVKVANWSPYKDANEMLQKGRSSDIAQVIFQAKNYRPDGIVAGSELTLEYLESDDSLMSYDPYPKLNSKLRGIRKVR